jgi:hypothetical protein
MEPNLRKTIAILSQATNVAVIAVVLLTAVVWFRHAKAAQSGTLPSLVGSTLVLPGVKASETTAVLFLSSKCHFCTESAPFYKTLAAFIREHSIRIRVVAAMPEPPNTAHEYLAKLGIPVDSVVQVEPGSTAVGGTPTLLLVDRKGRVTREWVGILSAEKRSEVLSQLTQNPSSD